MSLGNKLLLCLSGMLSLIANIEAGTRYTTSILNDEAMNPFVVAIRNEDIKEISSLIDMRADVNSPIQGGETPLMAAVYKGNIEICRLLIGAGAEIEAYSNHGCTPLFYALYDSEKEKMVQYLIEELHANVNMMDNSERTPLILAALNNHSKSIVLLVSAGAKMETKGEFGRTAFAHAIKNNSFEAAKVLLMFGAQLETRDEDSFTPLMTAVFKNNGPMIRFLLKAGADKHVRTTKVVRVRIKDPTDWVNWAHGQSQFTIDIPKGATLLDIARQFNKRAAEHILINEAGFE
ncbi:MAG TPA: ankyrin repeat domain-containing protein [Rhabdochlamydiaceae bacterium]|nr:ankyrin repeat domain-containing protein [Rhabdochlamydiaceae bacterium]